MQGCWSQEWKLKYATNTKSMAAKNRAKKTAGAYFHLSTPIVLLYLCMGLKALTHYQLLAERTIFRSDFIPLWTQQ